MEDFFVDGHVFISLYKKMAIRCYTGKYGILQKLKQITHWGVLGDGGEAEEITTQEDEFWHTIQYRIIDKIEEGYARMPIEKLYTVVITFKLDTWGTPEDLNRREEIREIITEDLGWTGNGRCDDADIGSGEMSLYADVVDPRIAVTRIAALFRERNIGDECKYDVMLGEEILSEGLDINEIRF